MASSLTSSHDELHQLVEEQAALRRVATLVARAAPPAEVFEAVPLWGMMNALWTDPGRLPSGLEDRLAQFTDLVATAIANADSRAELAASRARVVAAADKTRRRIIDDGVGGAHPQRGSGLIGLRDRIEALGGSFEVNSPERGGTQLIIEIPLTQP